MPGFAIDTQPSSDQFVQALCDGREMLPTRRLECHLADRDIFGYGKAGSPVATGGAPELVGALNFVDGGTCRLCVLGLQSLLVCLTRATHRNLAATYSSVFSLV